MKMTYIIINRSEKKKDLFHIADHNKATKEGKRSSKTNMRSQITC